MRGRRSFHVFLAVALLTALLALPGCIIGGGALKGTPFEIPASVTRQQAFSGRLPKTPPLKNAKNLLRLQDVQDLAGLINLRYVPRDPTRGAAGQVNIARSNGAMVVMMNTGSALLFDASKDGPNFGRRIEGLGDDAYAGPSPKVYPHEYIVGVKKGNKSVILATYFLEKSGVPILSISDLSKLARKAVSRLK